MVTVLSFNAPIDAAVLSCSNYMLEINSTYTGVYNYNINVLLHFIFVLKPVPSVHWCLTAVLY